jgi:predicted RNA methylase
MASSMPHPAVVTSGPQLMKVIGELEAGTYPQPEFAVWREDLPRDLAVRLALATGATMEQVEEGPSEYANAEPEPDPEPTPQPAEDEADVIIRHTHEDGTLVYGTSKGDGTAEILKANRFRWFPSIKLWGVAQSRDHLAKRWQINAAAEALRKAGFTVRVEIDDTPRDVADVKADRAGRLDARYERLTAKAERSKAEGDARHARAEQISERFAFGQPILVGHHSERRARRDHERMDQNDRAAHAAWNKAERAAAAAAVVGRADAYRELPAVIIRRIDKTEAELRQTMHYINGTRPANDWRGAYGYDREPASGAWLEQLEARKTFLEHQLAADREALAEHEANGYVRLTRETVHKGDRVFWGATWGDGIGGAIVTRTNPKTVTLDRRSYPRTLPYEQIKTVQCPHEGTETTVRAPRRQARPKPAPVTVERPPEREAPLAVGAGTECFATPPAVAAKMIEMAGLEPGMTVLEPSAGTGAIARPAAETGAEVTCIELDWKLFQRLAADERNGARVDGLYRSVQHGDFLEADPSDGPLYDRVLMNPPFRGQADVRHVTHALGFVKPGGMVVAVMSAGVEFRQDKTAETFREMVADRGGWIERLPDGAFEGSGTSVRIVTAVIPVSAVAEAAA